MKKEEKENLLAKYVSGNIKKEEEKRLLAWVGKDQQNKWELDQAKKIWKNSPADTTSWDTDGELARLRRSLGRSNKAEGRKLFLGMPVGLFYKAAAGLSLLFVFGYLLNTLLKNDNLSTLSTLSTGDTVSMFYLPDSSKVWLNTHSQLSFSEGFKTKYREVSLEGEAYFEVKKDTTHRFVVNTENTQTVVLGTSFNTHAYPDDLETKVTVVSGLVSFSPKNNSEGEVLLHPKQMGTLSQDGEGVQVKENDNPVFLQWRKENNPNYEKEKANLKQYLSHQFTWKKNKINQTVITGKITNTARLANCENITMKVTHHIKGGKKINSTYVVSNNVEAGKTISYKQYLFTDWLSNTSDLQIEIVKVAVKE